MQNKKIIYSLPITVLAFILAFSSWQPVVAQSGQPQSISGWFTILWGDSRSGSPMTAYVLTDDSGGTTPLEMDDAVAAPVGGVLSLDRRRVSVSGVGGFSAAGQAAFKVDSVTLEDSVGTQDVGVQAVTGSQPFISILCKFSNVSATPKSLTYFKNMYGSTYPGLDHYWREVSYNTINIVGSNAVGWYTLPHPRSYYVYDQNGDGVAELDFARAAQDCTSAADAAVNFTGIKGINMMFNAELDGYAWGGSQCMTLDGVNKCWPMTWEPPWGYSDITVISHEMGHAFGLPHSSGQYGQTYDNQWDVMSDGWSNCSNSTDATYGCLGQHTISYHKDKLGWIPAAKKFTATGNATITLEQLALPQTGNYLMAQIPINGSSTHFYTVEVRRKTGYDAKLPGQAVIIHDVNTARSIPAQVIDADGNGNTGDAGGQWTVGETFSDTANGIFVKVISATASGFQVSIQPGAVPLKAVFRSAATYDGWVLETSETSNKGGKINAGDSVFRLGDNVSNKQFRAILHFNTSSLPDTAVITKVTLKIRKQQVVGTNPFNTHGDLRVSIRKPYFGSEKTLQSGDFQAGADKYFAGPFGATPVSKWYNAVLSSAGASFVNLSGTTQFRLYFATDDDNDGIADFVKFYSGNASATNRPKLVVTYYVP